MNKYLKPELDVNINTEWQKTNQSQAWKKTKKNKNILNRSLTLKRNSVLLKCVWITLFTWFCMWILNIWHNMIPSNWPVLIVFPTLGWYNWYHWLAAGLNHYLLGFTTHYMYNNIIMNKPCPWWGLSMLDVYIVVNHQLD